MPIPHPLFAVLVALTVSLASMSTLYSAELQKISKLHDKQVLFENGDAGSKNFRIPAIVTALNGDLIAVIDVRRRGGADMQHTRDIDIGVRRSQDNGKTWGPIGFMTDYPDGQAQER